MIPLNIMYFWYGGNSNWAIETAKIFALVAKIAWKFLFITLGRLAALIFTNINYENESGQLNLDVVLLLKILPITWLKGKFFVSCPR